MTPRNLKLWARETEVDADQPSYQKLIYCTWWIVRGINKHTTEKTYETSKEIGSYSVDSLFRQFNCIRVIFQDFDECNSI
jgi:hypothetical protein